MIVLAPSPAPSPRHTAKLIANQMFTQATREVAAACVANTLFATAVQEVRTNR